MDALIDALLTTRSVAELPARVLEAVTSNLGWDFAAWWSVKDSRGLLEPTATWSRDASFAEFEKATRSRTFALGSGLPGRVWLEQQPIAIPDVTADDYFPRAIPASRGGVHGAVGFPVTVDGQVRAVVELFRSGEGNAPPDVLHDLGLFGQRIGLALARLASADQLARRDRISSLRADIASALASAGDVPSVLAHCTSAIVRHLDAAFARVWTVNASERTLELQASSGLYTHLDGPHSRIPIGAFKIGWIAESKQPHVTNSVATDPRVTDHQWAAREGMVSFAGHPLLVENRTVGVVAMFSRSPLSPDVLDELGPIAGALAQYVDRHNKERELLRSETLKAAMLDMARDAMIAMDATGAVVEFNSAAQSIFGYSRERAVGKQLADLIIPPDLRERHRMGMARFLATGEARVLGRTLRLSALRADGSQFPIELVISLIPETKPMVFAASLRPVE